MISRVHGNIDGVAVNNGGNPATHFGRQMHKERLARGWSLREFAARTGINIGHASRIENGKRPPTENVAAACDAAFPERKGWFTEYYQELSTWSEVPAAFKDWTEHEDRAATLRVWITGHRARTAADRGIRPRAADDVSRCHWRDGQRPAGGSHGTPAPTVGARRAVVVHCRRVVPV